MMEIRKASIAHWFFDNSPSKCGYCKSSNCSHSNGMWAEQLTVDDYQTLIDRGWRRSGKYCYKPIMDLTCCPLYTIRCNAVNFKPTKSQKKVVKKFNKYLKDGELPSSGPEDENARDTDVIGEHVPSMHLDANSKLVMCESKQEAERKPVEEEQRTSKEVKPPITMESTRVVKKVVKKGMGADPNKPPCKKAKLLRLERRKNKDGTTTVIRGQKKGEKSLEDLFAAEPQGKLKVVLVCSGDADEEWERTKSAEYEVYKKYQKIVHDDDVNMKGFIRFLVSSPLKTRQAEEEEDSNIKYGSFHQQYWLEDKLVAVGVIDILPKCVSSVYFFYDPAYRNLTLGTYGSLRELHYTRDLYKLRPSIEHYYMGYYNHSCPKMRYKGKLSCSDLLCPETYTWHRIEQCLPSLDAQKYCRFAGSDVVDENACTEEDIKQFKIFYNYRIYYFGNISYNKRMTECFTQIGSLCGKKCIDSLLIVDPQR
ncbi:PREDICTED: arginyl-tRNA--protein transferase 1 [Nicrophorus vespilloides]|uniref:Arginyl-tRNA--protein transferase 1 n=1 Tax=Nicrophorus vespilloides TaxID=110193 RepID=A0ABM1MXK3_NICVS|nr:PREDICTED: arginyl-tRNA--protein transferase 1 [Nicrophorus vespilloides]